MTRLGLRSPGAHQIAAIRVPHAAADRADGLRHDRERQDGVPPDVRRAGLWQRLGAYLNRSEAQAAPAPR